MPVIGQPLYPRLLTGSFFRLYFHDIARRCKLGSVGNQMVQNLTETGAAVRQSFQSLRQEFLRIAYF